MNRYYYKILLIVFTFFFICNEYIYPKQDNPVLAPDVSVVPVIDGEANEQCWQNIPWQTIDQVWIPYGGHVDSTDFSGRYKVVWSSKTNLLYFLLEIKDDVIVDGFLSDPKGAIYDYDMSEVFIDENASGGLHMYDQGTQNAENAFAYHMFAPFPADGETSHELYVDDMASSGRPDFTAHFPEFAIHMDGNTVTREFSLIVYNDTYNGNNAESARSQLTADKVMGLSIACNDNDNPNENPIVRDNMIGSVWEPSPGNLHWQNADYFGKVKLVTEIPSSVAAEHPVQAEVNSLKLFPNPAGNSSQLQIDNHYRGTVTINVFNILGQKMYSITGNKFDRLFTQRLNFDNLSGGIYFIQAQMGRSSLCKKLMISVTR